MTMTFAMMYPVETHEISSIVAPRFPIMCGIATLTIDVSMSSSTAASVTAMAMRYLCLDLSPGCATACSRGGAGAPNVAPAEAGLTVVLTPASPRHDVRFDGHARPEWSAIAAAARHLNSNRNPLHDLGEVACGIVGRQQSEL